MTPEQVGATKRLYDKEVQQGEQRPFDKWLQTVQAQEYIRGGVFPKLIPNWVGPKGEGRYTPQQMKLFQKIQGYLGSSPSAR